jgi:hypothetical protein
MGPPILMGDDTPVEVIGQGRVELPHKSFENVLHVPKLSMNLLYLSDNAFWYRKKGGIHT